ncbi:peptidoglycan-binding protein [Fictibacillus aquaticus]|uniref:peptidoglycan-binding protein n=1 Tax=Fictibacillus aquaticus TaxID=2021314 RepID=UPI0023E35725|nr:peptidoglycan-binding protein [Fictibacillus aquaticus]
MGLKYPITNMYIDSKWGQRPGGNRIPRYSVAHDTGNPGSSAMDNYRYFNSRNLSSSAHVFIDDQDILVIIPLNEKAYHVRQNVSDANEWAAGVELCWGGNIKFEEAYERYVWYFAYLCRQYNWNPELQIKGHFQIDPSRRTDPINAFKRYGKTFTGFITDVKEQLERVKAEEKLMSLLTKGDKGISVRKLQEDLADLGFYKSKIDGIFGLQTETAVRTFQRSYRITVDGKAGPQTVGAIQRALEARSNERILKRGSIGEDVRNLQSKLNALGFKAGAADGIFGELTEKAVREFQGKRSIAADGVAGTETKKELQKALDEKAQRARKPTPRAQVPASDFVYKVQLGAFSSEENAIALAEKAKKAGFDVIVKSERKDD